MKARVTPIKHIEQSSIDPVLPWVIASNCQLVQLIVRLGEIDCSKGRFLQTLFSALSQILHF